MSVINQGIQAVTDMSLLQNDIDNIFTWSQTRFNIGKCKFMLTTNKHTSAVPSLTLGNVALERVYQYKYLGISDDLKWDKHIDHVCSKVHKLIRMTYRNLYQHSDSSFLLTLYKSL